MRKYRNGEVAIWKRKAYGQLLEWKEKYADKYDEEKKGNTMNITILEKKTEG